MQVVVRTEVPIDGEEVVQMSFLKPTLSAQLGLRFGSYRAILLVNTQCHRLDFSRVFPLQVQGECSITRRQG